MSIEVCAKAEQVIYNAMRSRGIRLIKRVVSDSTITLHFEGKMGDLEDQEKYVIDIREDKFG